MQVVPRVRREATELGRAEECVGRLQVLVVDLGNGLSSRYIQPGDLAHAQTLL